MRIELNCAECGKNRFNIGDQANDEAIIRCYFCGHEIGTMGDLKARVAAEVLKRTGQPPSDEA